MMGHFTALADGKTMVQSSRLGSEVPLSCQQRRRSYAGHWRGDLRERRLLLKVRSRLGQGGGQGVASELMWRGEG